VQTASCQSLADAQVVQEVGGMTKPLVLGAQWARQQGAEPV
jgi:hypothetical protein